MLQYQNIIKSTDSIHLFHNINIIYNDRVLDE